MGAEENHFEPLYSLLQEFIRASWPERRLLLDRHRELLLSEDVDTLFPRLRENLVDDSDPRVISIMDDARVFLRRCRTWGIAVAWHFVMAMRLGDSIAIPEALEGAIGEIAGFLAKRDDPGREAAIRRMRSLLQNLPDRPADLFHAALRRDLAETLNALPRRHPQRDLPEIEAGLRLARPAYEAAQRTVSVVRLNRQLGETLNAEGRFDEALGFLTAAIAGMRQRFPAEELAWTLSSYGNVLDNLGRTEEGIAAFSEAVTLLPDSAALLRNRAEILIGARRLAEGEADLVRSVELAGNEESAHLWARRAELAIARGDGEGADLLLDKAEHRDPTMQLAGERAQAAWLKGDRERARESVEEFLAQENASDCAILLRNLEKVFAEHPSLGGPETLRALFSRTSAD